MTEKLSEERLRDLGLDRASIQKSMEAAVASLKKKYGEEEYQKMISRAAGNLPRTLPTTPYPLSREEAEAIAKWCNEGDDWIKEAGYVLTDAEGNVFYDSKNNKS
jgi:hypothetical protein